MLPRILPKDKFPAFVKYLMSQGRVAAPVAKGQSFAFAVLEDGDDVQRVRMDYDVTILPPKKYLLPVRETLLKFSGPTPDKAQQDFAAEPTIVLGVHPYDLHGLCTIDSALLTEPADPYYKARRTAARIIGLNISQYANEHQFMADMGTLDPPEKCYDLFMTDLGDRYYVEVGTQEGSELLEGSELADKAGPKDHKARQDFDARKAAGFTKKLPYNVRYLPELLDASYDSLLWDAVSRRCFSCGSCTNVCPTCYCFDVQDELNLDAVSGERRRTWDSCQVKEFAAIAGGENFREHRSSRLRHRMFRKGKFIMERTGRSGCVGCGRCSKHCVASISILEAFQQIADEAAETKA